MKPEAAGGPALNEISQCAKRIYDSDETVDRNRRDLNGSFLLLVEKIQGASEKADRKDTWGNIISEEVDLLPQDIFYDFTMKVEPTISEKLFIENYYLGRCVAENSWWFEAVRKSIESSISRQDISRGLDNRRELKARKIIYRLKIYGKARRFSKAIFFHGNCGVTDNRDNLIQFKNGGLQFYLNGSRFFLESVFLRTFDAYVETKSRLRNATKRNSVINHLSPSSSLIFAQIFLRGSSNRKRCLESENKKLIIFTSVRYY